MLDIDSSECTFMKDCSPCITKSRGAGYWLTNRGHKLNKDAALRLQGMRPADFQACVSATSLGEQIGNIMNINVLQRLLVSILPSSGLVPHGFLRDLWLLGKAQEELAATVKRARHS